MRNKPEARQVNIGTLEVDVIVNAANTALLGGSAVIDDQIVILRRYRRREWLSGRIHCEKIVSHRNKPGRRDAAIQKWPYLI
jgi:hypothetical protein